MDTQSIAWEQDLNEWWDMKLQGKVIASYKPRDRHWSVLFHTIRDADTEVSRAMEEKQLRSHIYMVYLLMHN